jgi:hypothetical protein
MDERATHGQDKFVSNLVILPGGGASNSTRPVLGLDL